jgi:hypothetical protein
VYLLHQDFWFWRSARPLVFGFLPIGLFYHAAYTLASSALLAMIVRRYWPSHLEDGHRKTRKNTEPTSVLPCSSVARRSPAAGRSSVSGRPE